LNHIYITQTGLSEEEFSAALRDAQQSLRIERIQNEEKEHLRRAMDQF